MNREKAIKELKEVNNNLTFYMKKKHALQQFIQEDDINSPYLRAYELKNDKNFFKEHGRQRTSKEIARLMNYSDRQVRRFLQDKKD